MLPIVVIIPMARARTGSGSFANSLPKRIPLLAFTLCLLLLPSFVHAHLAIIRQGAESSEIAETGDAMGSVVAAGDFNGDGYEDLATGAPNEAVGSDLAAGTVVISYGSEMGLTHVGAVHIYAGHVGGSTGSQQLFGTALAAADFNGDGYDDLAIGAPGVNSAAGAVYVLRGTSGGLTGWVILSQGLVAGQTAEAGDRFGFSLVAANFNQDEWGYVDLVVGSPGENGDAGVITQFVDGTGGPGFWDSAWFDEAVLGGINVAGNQFGYALAAGNVVYSAVPDLVVGAPWYDDPGPYGGEVNIGRVYVMKGMAGVGATQSDATFYQSNDCDQSVDGGNFGISVAVGYFRDNVDGYACVAVGEPNFFYWDPIEDFYYDQAGRVVILPGGPVELDTATFGEFYKADWGAMVFEYEQFGSVVAAGPFQVDDGYDDLVVGAPLDVTFDLWYSGYADAGCVFVGYGSAGGIGSGPAYEIYNGYHLNDPIEVGDHLGAALCLGSWDGTGRYGIAAGAPGEDNGTGQVHIIAPWRQTYGLGCQYALVGDCEDNYVYSLKPFDEVHIASTTKIMTILLASERSLLPPGDPNYVNLYQQYTLPAWACYIPGSRFHFGLGEVMTLRNLMYACLLRSGNDAAHAIADMLQGTGDPAVTVPAFAAEMNARAAALGMTGTHFHNPAGLDHEAVGPELGEHYSTPADMMKLCRAAMENPRFADVAGAVSFDIIRHFNIGGTPVDVPWTIQNIFAGALQSSVQEMTGIKGGATHLAQATGCFAAEDVSGDTALVGAYYTPFDYSDEAGGPDSANLMKLGMAECGYELQFSDGVDDIGLILPAIWSQIGENQGGGQEAPGRDSGDRAVSIYRLDDGADDGHIRVFARRNSEVLIEASESLELGVTSFDSHEGVSFTNMGPAAIQLLVEFNYGLGGSAVFDLEPRERGTLEAYESNGSSKVDASIIVTNNSRETAQVGIEELYKYEVPLGPGANDFLAWQTNFQRNGHIVADGIDVIVQGMDPTPVAYFRAVVENPLFPVGVVEEVGPVSIGAGLRLLPAFPNPFSSETRVAFDLFRDSEVQVRIYDVRGRLVRNLTPGKLEAGRRVLGWDGRDGKARTVAQGVYFYEFLLNGEQSGSGKFVLLR